MNEQFMVLPDRECGSVRPGLYAVSERGPGGQLLPFTAIAAPFEVAVANPRAAQLIDMRASLEEEWLAPPGAGTERYKGLPAIGVGDLWGRVYYKSAWDAIKETGVYGICRRISKIPSVKPPYPVLMVHKEAALCPTWTATTPETWDKIAAFMAAVFGEGAWSPHFEGAPEEEPVAVWHKPWREAETLGRVGDDAYLDHPYVALLSCVKMLKERRRFSDFKKTCGVTFREAVFGLAWVTAFVQVLRPDQEEVDPKLAAQGVLPAIRAHDPRAE